MAAARLRPRCWLVPLLLAARGSSGAKAGAGGSWCAPSSSPHPAVRRAPSAEGLGLGGFGATLEAPRVRHLRDNASLVEELAARSGGRLAVVFNPSGHTPSQYGHVHEWLFSVYQAFIYARGARALARNRSGARAELTVYVPAGAPDGRPARVFDELAGLFGGARSRALFGVRVVRAGWVPLCLRDARRRACCEAHGRPPHELAGRVLALTRFQLSASVPGGVAGAFRDDARAVLGAAAAPDTFLYARAATQPSGRRVANEGALVRLLAAHAARARPWLRFVAADAHALAYADEARLYARAAVAVSLFGSSLHNCRYMARGASLLELHGALVTAYASGYLYHHECALELGLLHAPYMVHGALPLRPCARANQTKGCAPAGAEALADEPDGGAARDEGGFLPPQRPRAATVHLRDFGRWLERVLPAPRRGGACAPRVPWAAVFGAYEREALRAPYTGVPRARVRRYASGDARARAPLPPHYAACVPPWDGGGGDAEREAPPPPRGGRGGEGEGAGAPPRNATAPPTRCCDAADDEGGGALPSFL